MKTDIGRYMIGACAIIKHPSEDKILIIKRADNHRHEEWEFPGGRIDQHEEITQGLVREIREETGLTNVSIIKPLRFWHIYRGEKSAENEIFGFTFLCSTETNAVVLEPSEHSAHQWVPPADALELIADEGIKKDVEVYLSDSNMSITNLSDETLL